MVGRRAYRRIMKPGRSRSFGRLETSNRRKATILPKGGHARPRAVISVDARLSDLLYPVQQMQTMQNSFKCQVVIMFSFEVSTMLRIALELSARKYLVRCRR